jgi:H2-forming N5,N10-methylenetetrahydromethanopterin dehydrogenase-like enzyme
VPEDKVSVFTRALGEWPLGTAVIGRVAAAAGHDVVVR